MNTLALPFLWPYCAIFWAIFIWGFWPELVLILRTRSTFQRSTDRHSTTAIVLGLSLAFSSAFAVGGHPSMLWPKDFLMPSFVIGLLLFIAGSLLRRHCKTMLGEYFTAAVTVRASQPVISVGAYQLLRHPSYTGGLMMNTGIGIAIGSWASSLVLLLVSLLVYHYRIVIEERELLALMGDPYREYTSKRKRMIPFVY